MGGCGVREQLWDSWGQKMERLSTSWLAFSCQGAPFPLSLSVSQARPGGRGWGGGMKNNMCHQISETMVAPDTSWSSEVCWEEDWESQAVP